MTDSTKGPGAPVWTLVRVGDTAVVATCGDTIDLATNRVVLAVANAMRSLRRTGVRDVVESYCAVTVHIDPLRCDVDQVTSDLERLVSPAVEERVWEADSPDGREVVVPVSYGGDCGPDLGAVAASCGLSEADVVRRHVAVTYRVYMLGFIAGFAYLGGLDPVLRVSRRATPRSKVPAGSVGIAAGQTGVYPVEAPGGWHLIGRTALRMFDPTRGEPSLLRPGDRVRFEAVDASVVGGAPR